MEGKKKIKCDVCQKFYKKPYSNWKDHLLSAHNRNHSCQKCAKSFENEAQLKSHNKQKHSKKTYECEKCKNSYSSKASLRQHFNYYSNCKNGEEKKSVTCDICGKSLQAGLSFSNHKRSGKCATSKPGNCTLCGTYFKDQRSMSIHLTRMHKCEKCEKSRIQNLKDHRCNEDESDNTENDVQSTKFDVKEIMVLYKNVLDLVKEQFPNIPSGFEQKLHDIFEGASKPVEEPLADHETSSNANPDEITGNDSNLENHPETFGKSNAGENMEEGEVDLDNEIEITEEEMNNSVEDENHAMDFGLQEQEINTCNFCDKRFSFAKGLKEHIKQKHDLCAMCNQKWDNADGGFHNCKLSEDQSEDPIKGNDESGSPEVIWID